MKEKLKLFLFPFFLLLLIALLAAFKISGTSISIYDLAFYSSDYKDPNLLFGQTREIRYDEWEVQTPIILSQVEIGFKDYNTLYLAGQSFTNTDAPEKNWAVFDPINWSFFVLPLEQAFAFKWWAKAFILAIAIYFLTLMLTKNNIPISAIAAIAFVFSPYIQWYYSTQVTEVASFGILTFIFFIRIVNSLSQRLVRWINALLFSYFAICFALTFYPPFQFPLVVFFALVGAGVTLLKRLELGKRKEWRALIITVMVSITAIGAILVLYYFSNRTSIQAEANTIYPGSRQAVGVENGFSIKALAGFFNVQLQNDAAKLPAFLANQCEASSFFFFSFFLLPFFLFFLISSIIRRERLDLPLFFALVWYALLLLWETTGLPAIIAKLLLLSYVPAIRTIFSLGVINFLLIIYFITRLEIEKTLNYKIVVGVYSVVIFLIILLFGKYIHAAWPGFINSGLEVFMIAAACGVMMALLLLQRQLGFFSIFLVFSLLSTFYINPLYRGLSPLRNEKFLNIIEPIKNKDPQAGWVVYGNYYMAPYLVSNGIRVLNGDYFYPNLSFWYRFDPQHKYVDIYNRYSTVNVVDSPSPQKIQFDLIRKDAIQLEISPCNPVLEEVGVKYYLLSELRPDLACVSLIDTIEYETGNFYVYERIK
jgi:hypothetical protein